MNIIGSYLNDIYNKIIKNVYVHFFLGHIVRRKRAYEFLSKHPLEKQYCLEIPLRSGLSFK